MDTINPHACREGFEQQRKAGINVDWFTWQIAWHDAMFTQVDCAALATAPEQGGEAVGDLASMTRMFHAACADLGAINQALGLDPDDGGAEPIINAINELKRERDQWVDTQYANSGECVSCIDGKCVTGLRCVTLARDSTEAAIGEPVAWMWNSTRACASVEELKRDKIDPMQHNMTPLYTAPPPASTNRLTDEQILEIISEHSEWTIQGYAIVDSHRMNFARAIIAATEGK